MKTIGKSKAFLLLLLVMVGTAKGQMLEFAPVGAEWHYGINNISIEGYVRVKSVGDTLMNGILCRKIEKRYFLYDYMDDNEREFVKGYEFISQTGDSVYMFRFGQFHKLYDFSSEIGDTVFFPGSYSLQVDDFVSFGDSIGKAVVIGKGVCGIGGVELKYYDIRKVDNSAWAFDQDFYLGYARICEKIGNLSGYLFPNQQIVADYFEGGCLRCYTDNELGTINFSNPYIECDYFHSIEEDTFKLLAAYPNPFKEKIVVDLPIDDNYTIMIYDQYGRMVINQDFIGRKADVNFPFPQSGVFHLIVQSNSNSYRYVSNVIKL